MVAGEPEVVGLLLVPGVVALVALVVGVGAVVGAAVVGGGVAPDVFGVVAPPDPDKLAVCPTHEASADNDSIIRNEIMLYKGEVPLTSGLHCEWSGLSCGARAVSQSETNGSTFQLVLECRELRSVGHKPPATLAFQVKEVLLI